MYLSKYSLNYAKDSRLLRLLCYECCNFTAVRNKLYIRKQLTTYKELTMARYIKQEMPDLNGTGETKCYYRLEKRRNLSTKEFLKKAGAHGILDDGILKHALSKIAEQLVEELADGNTVTLEGIGTFQATLGVKKDKEMDTIDGDETKRNAKSIEVKNVRYVSDKDLVNDVNLHCKLTRAGVSRVNRSPYTKEERLKMLQDYLADATHPFIRVADYAGLTSLPRSTATKELRTFSENPANGITTSGRRTAIVYVKRVEI